MTEPTIETSTFTVSGSEKAPIRVLHVDDDAGFVEVAKQCLEMQGNIEVETANSVEEAFKMLKEKAYDVIVSDYQMPGKSGLEFLRELREAGNQIPFVMFTGKGREEVAVKALNLGANQYISKFGDPDAVYGELAYAVDHAVEVRKAREALLRSEANYRSLVEEAGAGILTVDTKGVFTFVNKELCNTLGVSKEELLGKRFSDFIHPDDRQRIIQIFVDFMKNPNSRPRFEFRAIHKRGHVVYLHSAPTLLKYQNEMIGSHAIITDVTERKKFALELLREKERFQTYLGLARVIMIAISAEGIVTFINKKGCEALKCTEDEVIGKDWFNNFLPKRIRKETKDYSRKLLSGQVQTARYHENLVITRNGEERLIAWYSALLRDETGKIVGHLSSGEDITSRVAAEKKLKESEEKYRTIVESSADAIFEFSKDGELLSANHQAARMLGMKSENTIGKNIYELFPTDIAHQHLSILTEVFQSGKPILDRESQTQVGSNLRWVNTSLIPIKDKHDSIVKVLGFSRDITENRKIEEKLRESEDKFRSLVENASVAIAISDMKGRFSYVNKALNDLLGYSEEELMGQPFKNFIHPADRGRIVRLFLRSVVLPLGPRKIELRVLRKDGGIAYITSIPTRFSVRGKTIGFLAIMTEITEQKKSLEMMKTLNEKMEVVGSLTRHDLRNKLSNILGRVWLAKKKLAENHEALIDLDEVESSISQAERILDFAGTYEKLGIEELAYVDVSTSIRQAISILPKAQSELQGVKITDETQGLMVLADSLLRQLFYNLIHNSIEHGERVVHITIRYARVGGDLKLIYEDDGVGIPKGEKKKIFKEGYGKGSGYGLFLIRKMCEVFGWAISETGKEGKGAQFTITIPEGRFELPQ